MGCWNETDMLSQLPIMAGDPVKVFILLEELSEFRLCGCDSAWKPLCLPISGQYNDYGCIENIIEDWNTQAILNHCNEMLRMNMWLLSERGKEMAEYDKDLTQFPYTSIQTLLKAIERDYLCHRACYPTERKHKTISLVMIHDEMYQAAIGLSDIPDSCLNEAREKITAAAAELCEIEKLTKTESYNNDAAVVLNVLRRMSQVKIALEFSSLTSKIVRTFYWDLLGKVTEEQIQDLLGRIIDNMHLFSFMSQTRRQFSPQAGGGSQDAEFITSACFFAQAIEFAKKKDKQLAGEWHEEN